MNQERLKGIRQMQQIKMVLKLIHSNFVTQRTPNAPPTNEENHQNGIQNRQIKISHFQEQPTWAISESIIENSLTNTDQFILHNNSAKKSTYLEATWAMELATRKH